MPENYIIPSFSKDLMQEFNIAEIGLVHDPNALSYEKYQSWVKQGNSSYLTYLSDERANKRKSLLEIFPNFKSALVFLMPYKKSPSGKNGFKIADYVMAFNDQDYHQALPENIKKFLHQFEWSDKAPYKIVLDTSPVLERDLAYRAGLGWFGKNSMLINKKWGSYFIIVSVLFEIKLVFDTKKADSPTAFETDHCGSCNACVESCPTQAIIKDKRQIEIDKCIASYTIEIFTDKKNPPTGSSKGKEIYGCDICQTVCPWNSKIETLDEIHYKDSLTNTIFLNNSADDIIENLKRMSKRQFKKLFAHSPIARTGRDSLIKNIKDKIN